MSNVFLNALEDAVNAIKKNKRVVLMLLLLQVVFVALLGSVQLYYQFQIFEKSQEVTDYMNQLPLEDTEAILQQQNIFGDDPSVIFEGTQTIQKAWNKLIILSVLIVLFFNVLNWGLTDQLFHKKKKSEWKIYAGKFIAVAAVYAIIYVILLNIFLGTSLSDYLIEEAAHLQIIPGIVLLLVAYCMFISFALVGKTKLREIAKNTLKIGFRKAHWMLLTYAVNTALLLSSGWLFFRASNAAYSLLIGAGILFLAAFVWGRIFAIATVNRLRS